MENIMKKTFWAGLVSNEIRFFTQNPEGNVDGLQGARKLTVTDQCALVDDSGHSIVDSSFGTGNTDGANLNTGQQGSGETQQQPQSGGQATTA
jgi:hypothetical protein